MNLFIWSVTVGWGHPGDLIFFLAEVMVMSDFFIMLHMLIGND